MRLAARTSAPRVSNYRQRGASPASILHIAPAASGVVIADLQGDVFVVLKRSRRKAPEVAVRPQLTAGEADLAASEDIRRQLQDKLNEQQAAKERQELEALAALKLPAVKTQKTEVLTKHLSSETKKDPMATAHILRTWLNER